jgi:large subunit ribosomal protein L10
LVKILNDNKAQAPAKAGDVAPKDIIVPAKDTGFPPGAVISELNAAGLQTKVQSGTIHIKEEKTVAKKGDEISLQLSIVLTKLNIFPMAVGLILYAALDNGVLLKAEDIQVDFEEILAQLKAAHFSALNLSVEISYPTRYNIVQLLQRAQQGAKSVIRAAPIFEKEFINDVLFKANNDSNILLSIILKKDPNALPIEKPKKVEEEKIDGKKDKKPDDGASVGIGDLFR